MVLSERFLSVVTAAANAAPGPLVLPWPALGKPAGFRSFETFSEWCDVVLDLSVSEAIPRVTAQKYERAQRLFLLAWIDADLIKAGELAALVALELAVKDRYGHKAPKPAKKSKKKKIFELRVETAPFADLLKFMVDCDGLTDDQIPMIRRYGGTAKGFLTGELRPSLADRRNSAAHGDPFDSSPVGGLLELIRDLIDYAYRDFIAEAQNQSPPTRFGRDSAG